MATEARSCWWTRDRPGSPVPLVVVDSSPSAAMQLKDSPMAPISVLKGPSPVALRHNHTGAQKQCWKHPLAITALISP